VIEAASIARCAALLNRRGTRAAQKKSPAPKAGTGVSSSLQTEATGQTLKRGAATTATLAEYLANAVPAKSATITANSPLCRYKKNHHDMAPAPARRNGHPMWAAQLTNSKKLTQQKQQSI